MFTMLGHQKLSQHLHKLFSPDRKMHLFAAPRVFFAKKVSRQDRENSNLQKNRKKNLQHDSAKNSNDTFCRLIRFHISAKKRKRERNFFAHHPVD